MLRFLGKTTSSAATSGESIPSGVSGGEEELSMWEVVNWAHSDDEDLYSYDSEDAVSIGDNQEPIPDEEDGEDDDDVDKDAPTPLDFVSPSDNRDSVDEDDVEYYVDGDVNDVDEDVDDDYDVDDELVPWKLKGRFGKQRIVKMGIRKMGQRGGPKLKSKKLPYYDNRPGWSYGKLR